LDDGLEVRAIVAAERSWHVLPDGETRSNMLICPASSLIGFSHLLYDPDSFKEQVASLSIVNTQPFASH
jgi:hypothetical protein